MKQDEAEKLARTCLERLKNGAAVGLLDEDVTVLCNYLLSGDMKREIENTARLEAMEAIRRGCIACEGSGQMGDHECEYCGRPSESVRALIQPPAQKENGK